MVTYASGTCTKMFILNSTIMATIKTVLRPYKNNEGKQQITIRVSHQGKTCYHSTGEYILVKYFSTKEGIAKATLSGWIQINTRLDNIYTEPLLTRKTSF